jgi:hypothetical protein
MTERRRELLVPSWIPADERGRLDLAELADADAQLRKECDRLGGRLGAYVAAYRAGAKARPTGLCSVFQFARLSPEQAAALAESEERQSGVILVAYARPLARW